MRCLVRLKMKIAERVAINADQPELLRQTSIAGAAGCRDHRLHTPIGYSRAKLTPGFSGDELGEQVKALGIKGPHTADVSAILTAIDKIGGGELDDRRHKLAGVAVHLDKLWREGLRGHDKTDPERREQAFRKRAHIQDAAHAVEA